MARSINEIYNAILNEKASYNSLSSLNNTSNASIWRTIFYIIASAIAIQEQIQDVFISDMNVKATKLPTGTTKWYAQQVLNYQQGYTVTYNRELGNIGYEVIDEDAKIIKVATCETEDSNIIIKAIKTADNVGIQLTTDEYNSVLAYINDIKFAGPTVYLISDPADILQLDITVQVNPSVIKTTGQSINNSAVYPVEDAINNLLLSYQNENFDSEIKLIKIVDAIQNINGVKNVVISNAKAKAYNAPSLTDIMANSLQVYKANSGWLSIDETYTLRDHITYTV